MEAKRFYDFENFRLDLKEKVLVRDGKPVSITPKVFQLLTMLIENRGRLIEKNELMNGIWKDSFVEEGNLTFHIRQLRKALGDDAHQPDFIETIPTRGYRFIAEVTETNDIALGNGTLQTPAPVVETAPPTFAFRKFLFPITGLVVLLIGAITIASRYAEITTHESVAPVLSSPFGSERLSSNGKVRHAAISADGKNVVHTSEIEGRQSIWLRQLDTANSVEIIPLSDDLYNGLQLSPDGNFLYFNRRHRPFGDQGDIYRVSIFGGIPTKIIDQAHGWMSVSADGTKISFVRCAYRDDEYCSLLIADAQDGQNERKLASRPRPLRIGDNAISPDGTSVAFAVGQSETQANEFGLVEVDVDSGVERELTTERFFNIKSLVWLPDKNGLLLTASRIPNRHFRIWEVSAASGKVSPITNDSESYSALSLDREGRRLVSTLGKQDFLLHLIDLKNPSATRVLADATSVAFGPDGKVVFSSPMSGNDEIWSINADGSQQRQLTNNSADELVALFSPDGNSIFFSSNRTGEAHVWRMNADGSNQAQITQKTGGSPLFISPDGRWLYFHHRMDKTVWRVSTATHGEEQLVLDKRLDRLAFSPDGSRIAFAQAQGDENTLVVVSLPDGNIVKSFKSADPGARTIQLNWSPDGEHLAYILVGGEFEINTLWLHPLNGTMPQQIASLGDERIASRGFALAPDGRYAGVVKGDWLHDAVLITGLR